MRKTKPSDKDGGDDDEKSTSSANKCLTFLYVVNRWSQEIIYNNMATNTVVWIYFVMVSACLIQKGG